MALASGAAVQLRFLVSLLVACACASDGASSGDTGASSTSGSSGVAGSTGSSSEAGTSRASSGSSGDIPMETCDAAIEAEIVAGFSAAAQDTTITDDPDATLVLIAADGRMLVTSNGDSTAETSYESASTSKWVTAAIILDLVDQGLLELDTATSDVLEFWPAPGVPLRSLLSFTSGFDDEAPCINSPIADFADCVEQVYQAGAVDPPPPGTVYHYASSHLQIAGLMAIRASGAADWQEVFAAWQARTGMFPTGAYDLPSATNPRLAGGMHWNALEYVAFVRALADGDLLAPQTLDAMLADQRGDAIVEVSPALLSIGEDWSYGFGNWLECAAATGGPNSYDCAAPDRNSSAGAYGAYPFYDASRGYVGIVARQGALASGGQGVGMFRAVEDEVEAWAGLACAVQPERHVEKNP